jgi:hypothetical protein
MEKVLDLQQTVFLMHARAMVVEVPADQDMVLVGVEVMLDLMTAGRRQMALSSSRTQRQLLRSHRLPTFLRLAMLR